MKRIKLLWDFRGPDALETAKHHCKHLEEFAAIEKITVHEINHQEQNPMLVSAYLIIEESDLNLVKNALKPHKGFFM